MVTRAQDGEAMRLGSAEQGKFNQIEAARMALKPAKAIEDPQMDCAGVK
jgi:hypothetical protein